MSAQPTTNSAIPLAGLLLLAAIGNYLWPSPSLDSYRPEVTINKAQLKGLVDEVPARLWQDPIKAVEHFHKDVDNFKFGFTTLEKKEIIDGNTKVLAVLLPGGEYAEIEERRKRRRYATIAALLASGYAPKLNDGIKFIPFVENNDDVEKGKYLKSKVNSKTILTPYEVFEYEVRHHSHDSKNAKPIMSKKAIVVWISEKHLKETKILLNIQSFVYNVLDNVFEYSNEKPPKFSIIGPSSSSTLLNLAKEIRVQNDYPNQLLEKIYSPIATIPDNVLLKNLTSGLDDDDKKSKLTYWDTVFTRLIARDDMKANVLIGELENRIKNFKPSDVVIVSEMDSHYGRNLRKIFEDKLKPDNEEQRESKFVGYYRGIDGRTVTVGTSENNGPKFDSENPGEDSTESKIKKPIGDAQYDYLRRLSDKIRKYRPKAIGIFGNDVYDKLLILRALRKNFPTTLFFTTDLDARLLHPGEFRYTRNMLVASGYGLELNTFKDKNSKLLEDYQEAIPPFRDSYQTSLYYATRKALSFEKDFGFDKYMLSAEKVKGGEELTLLYEVSRNGAHLINRHDRNAPGELKLFSKYLLIVFFFGVNCILFSITVKKLVPSPNTVGNSKQLYSYFIDRLHIMEKSIL